MLFPPPSLVLILDAMQPAHSPQPSIFQPLFFFSLRSLCLTHTGNPTGVALSHCITWFQSQLLRTTCQIRYHSHCGIIVALDSSDP